MSLHQTSEDRNSLHGNVPHLRCAFCNESCLRSLIANILTDVLAFIVIVILAVRSAGRDFKMPFIIRSIVQDSTVYFLVIFTSHLLLEMMLLLSRVSVPVPSDVSVVKGFLAKPKTLAGYVSTRFVTY